MTEGSAIQKTASPSRLAVFESILLTSAAVSADGIDEPYRIRTCDPLLKRQLLCQTELTALIPGYSTITRPIWQTALACRPFYSSSGCGSSR